MLDKLSTVFPVNTRTKANLTCTLLQKNVFKKPEFWLLIFRHLGCSLGPPFIISLSLIYDRA